MKLYLVLMSTSSFLLRAIKVYTNDGFNHASISLTPDLREMYSFGRKKIKNPLIGGFVQEEVTHEFFLRSNCIVYECELSRDQYSHILRKIDYFNRHRDYYRYNFAGLLALAMRYKLKRQNAYFCSQFVGEILEESGVCQLPKSKYLVTPTDLSKIECFNEIYSGTLEGYLHKVGIIRLENKAGANNDRTTSNF